MKKIFACLISLLIGFSPIAYASEIYTNYDFSDEAQAEFDRQREIQTTTPQEQIPLQIKQDKHIIKGHKQQPQEQPLEVERKNYVLPEIYGTNNELYKGSIVTIPQGSTLKIQLQSGVSSGSLDLNDQLTATLIEDWVYNNNLIAPAGSFVYGTVTKVTPAGYAYGGAKLELYFNKVITPDGNFYEIATEPINITSESKRALYMTRDILVGIGLGLLGGLIGCAISGGSDDMGKTMAIMGGIGATGGAVRGASQRGQDADIDADMPIQLILTKSLNAAPYQGL